MKIAIVSDIHDNLANLNIFLAWIKKENIEKIICLGDVTDSDTLSQLATKFGKQIFLVHGNVELYDIKDVSKHPNIQDFGKIGMINLDRVTIGFVHEPTYIKKLQSTNSDTNFDYIFYGHTHKPWLNQENGTIIANPGNLSNTFHAAAFATLDTENNKLELKIVADLN